MTDSISSHYKFWDNFVSDWRNDKYAEVEHLPEPWWGWCSEDDPLHSVTINIAPGPGGNSQTRQFISSKAGCEDWTYSGLMANTLREHLNAIEQWHLDRRYKPLMRALGVDEKDMAIDTSHHLSIELQPNHHAGGVPVRFKKADDITISHTLLFAAQAATMIVPPESVEAHLSLKNIVIVRSSIHNIEKITGKKLCGDSKDSIVLSDNTKVFRASCLFAENHPQLEDVWFVCLTAFQNNLPGKERLKEIIKQINNHL